MTAKRAATMRLDHDNWEQEMPKEEAGVFKLATEEEIGRRVLKKAKRRVICGDGESSANKAFSALKGFCSPSINNKPSFSFLKNDTPSTVMASPVVNGETNGNFEPIKGNSMDSVSSVSTATNKTPQTKNEYRTEYYRQLRCLNEGVLAWIKHHVDKNAYCILSPIFLDYDRHVRELDLKYPSSKTTAPAAAGPTRVPSKPEATVALVDTENSASVNVVDSAQSNTSKIIWPTLASVPIIQSPLQLCSTGVVGSSGVNASVTETRTGNDDDTYEPPKNEIQEVKEVNAFYSIRCKLFYKKESSFVEKGVGTLYMKSTADDKTQLLIRAETNLGNILLNILLTAKLPTARMGKNNVSLVCIPNPPIDPKATSGSSDGNKSQEPVTFLVRVKSTEDADLLLAKLNEHKS